MRFFNTLSFILIFIIGTFYISCTDNETISDNKGLTFSQDTLSFDTIFTGVTTSTAWLKVYNNNKKPLNISEVSLLSSGNSGFRINLDGENAGVFRDVVIPAGDSLFLFVALTPKVPGQKSEVLEDAIVFKTDEGIKRIILKAVSLNAIKWKSKIISRDTIIENDLPIIVYDSLVVSPGVTLTIRPGATFYMHNSSKVIVHGRISANGESSLPVTFRGDRLEYMLEYFPYDYNPGQWHFIHLTESSYGNTFNHVKIRGAYYGIVAESSSPDSTKFTMTNSVVHNFVYSALWSINSKISISNTELSNSGSYTVCLIGGRSVFTHCTLTNYMNSGLIVRDGPVLVLANATVDSLKRVKNYPLHASFRNSIIYGTDTEEVGLALTENNQYQPDILFESCMIRTKTNLGSLAKDCIYPDKPGFRKLGTYNEKYIYDFRPDSISPAIDKADRKYSESLPFDLYGVSRLSDKAPDIGAYEYTERVN